MTHIINSARASRLIHTAAALLLPVAVMTSVPEPAAAEAQGSEEIRIRLPADALAGPESRSDLRLRVRHAAAAHCGDNGVAAVYRGGSRRCREQVMAAAEREIERRLPVRLAERGAH